MSIAEFYIENNLDPGDPDSFGRWMAGQCASEFYDEEEDDCPPDADPRRAGMDHVRLDPQALEYVRASEFNYATDTYTGPNGERWYGHEPPSPRVVTSWHAARRDTRNEIAARVQADRAQAQSRQPSAFVLDEDELDWMARSQGWEKISVPRQEYEKGMVSYRKDDCRLNFWRTTGTVGSYLEHPRQGKTQLFRRDISRAEAPQIFNNPRQHTGRGYHNTNQRRRSRSRSRSREPSERPTRSRSRDRAGGQEGTLRVGHGVVQRWNDERGFGFIRDQQEGAGADLFCHVSAIQNGNCLRSGDHVQYDVVFDERKGKHRAENLSNADGPRWKRNDARAQR